MNPAQPMHSGTSTREGTASQASAIQPLLPRISHYATIALVGFFALFLFMVVALSIYGGTRTDQAYSGVSIAGMDVSGKNRSEISALIDTTFYEYQQQPVSLVANGQTFEISLADLGITIDKEATIERAMRYGRDGSFWDRSIDWARAAFETRDVEPVVTVDSDAFYSHLSTMAPSIVALPQDAYVDFGGSGDPVLVADIPGTSINVDATRSMVMDKVQRLDAEPVQLSLITIPASVNSAAIESGLPDAQRAVASAVMLSSEEGQWPVEPDVLKQLVWIDDGGTLNVREDDAKAVIETVSANINRSSQDAGVTVDGEGNFIIIPAIFSASVDIDASTEALIESLKQGETDVPLVVERAAPKITDEVATIWADKGDKLAGDGVTVTWGDETAKVSRAEMIWAMVIEPQPDNVEEPFRLTFDQAVLAEMMLPLAEQISVEPQDVVFRLDDSEIKLVNEAIDGQELNMEASVKAVNDAAMDGSFNAKLTIDDLKAAFTKDDQDDISVEDVLGDSTTYYGNSSEPRRKNVERGVELEDGWLIPPGGIFSFAGAMGLVTPENGFVTGYGIVADPSGGVTTAPVVGGGICQVSTTIFQAAWWSGLEIVERWEHPYWLLAYGEAPRGMMGLDAMVNIEPDWALDLKFKNVTDNWIAVDTWADGEDVGTQILGTSQGWTVDTPQPKFDNIVKADGKMIYTDTSELPKGEELQVETAKDGFDATVTRTVRDENGNIVSEYSMPSTYAASRNMTLRGTGSGTSETIDGD